MVDYDFQTIEQKWQDYWYNNDKFKAIDFDPRPKFYGLVEFPYPSGAGMHIGHIKAFSAMEVVARKRRMQGYNVLFPIGFDAFGLPTENYAIKTGIHPREVTDKNIITFTNQLKKTGFSFDWSRVIDTTQVSYYRWTEWIFLQLYKKGLAYKSKTYVNYCPSCKVVLANEESQGGKCDRCHNEVIQLEKEVWFLKITAYADELLKGLADVDYPNRIKVEQENWIGKSSGAEVTFKTTLGDDLIIFTTRPDTLFGATFMVIAPEHPMMLKRQKEIKNYQDIVAYQEVAKHKTEFERVQLAKDKTGVEIQGIKAINPLTQKEIPIFVADYVMMGYGTGAIMAVPAHDTRDYDFAKKFKLPVIEVIEGGDIAKEAFTSIETGKLINSDFLNGLSVKEAKTKIIKYLTDQGIGHEMVNFKMKDWAFNRQRYWGEPIPIINCPHCGLVPVPEKDLPVILPNIKHFQPGDNGESPLNNVTEYRETTCPICGEKAIRETDTMPQWAGSSWYFLRYCDPNNDKCFADYEKLKYWMPVDWYNGGMEHVTRHMIYSRFWNQFLFDQKLVPYKEPYKRRTAIGLILGPDGDKMSKSKGNVIDPLDIIKQYGADVLRLHILFMGEYDQPTPWSDLAIKGIDRFLNRVYHFQDKLDKGEGYHASIEPLIHKTIKEVGNDIEQMKFNTAISKLMILSNAYAELDSIHQVEYEVLIKLLNPFAPHICEELNQKLGHKECLVHAPWPSYDESKTIDNEVEIGVQVNGKFRGTIVVKKDANPKEMEQAALALPSVQAQIKDKTVRKVICIPNKIVNIVAN